MIHSCNNLEASCSNMEIMLIIISLLFFGVATADEKETLRLGVLVSQTVFDFSGSLPAIDLAIESIAADKTLPFTFTYTHNDSKVRSYVAT